MSKPHPHHRKPCPYCGRKMNRHARRGRFAVASRYPSKDHVVPKSAGGKKTIRVCYSCNQTKGAAAPLDWLMHLAVARPEFVTSALTAWEKAGIDWASYEFRKW